MKSVKSTQISAPDRISHWTQPPWESGRRFCCSIVFSERVASASKEHRIGSRNTLQLAQGDAGGFVHQLLQQVIRGKWKEGLLRLHRQAISGPGNKKAVNAAIWPGLILFRIACRSPVICRASIS